MTPAYYSIVSNNTEVLARRRCHGWRRLMMMLGVVCARLMAGASYIPTPTCTRLIVHIYIGIHSTFIGRIYTPHSLTRILRHTMTWKPRFIQLSSVAIHRVVAREPTHHMHCRSIHTVIAKSLSYLPNLGQIHSRSRYPNWVGFHMEKANWHEAQF